MIVRAALAALACLAARVAGQFKVCDPTKPEIIFHKHTLVDDMDGARGVLAADVNSDGDKDILVVSDQNNKFRWFENDLYTGAGGNISFAGHEVVNARTAYDPWSVHAADLDGDGDVDLLLSYGLATSDSFITWYENDNPAVAKKRNVTEHTGTPFTDSSKEHTIEDSYAAKETVMVHGIDVDGDGEPDALAAVAGDNKVVVYTGDWTDPSTTTTPITISDSNVREPWSVFPADVDGDSDVDILVAASDAGGRVALYDNDGATPPTFTQHLVAPPDDDGGLSLTDPRYVTAVDLLGDGGAPLRLDLLVASNNDGYIGWYQNTGAGGKTLPTDCGSCEMLLTSSSSKDPNNDNAKGAMSVKAADFNGDGCLDVLYAGSNLGPAGGPTKIVWELNNCATNPTFVKNVIKGLTAYDGDMFWVEAADLDEDGDIDVTVAANKNRFFNWYENDCAGSPTSTPTADFPTGVPTALPSSRPSPVPISEPTAPPTTPPSSLPTSVPTTPPSPVPTVPPTAVPTGAPTSEPTGRPTVPPTALPTGVPTTLPSSVPTVPPTPIPAPIPTPAPTPRPSVRCSAGVAFSTEHDVEASGRYLNVHVVDGAKIKVARRLPRPSARRRGTGRFARRPSTSTRTATWTCSWLTRQTRRTGRTPCRGTGTTARRPRASARRRSSARRSALNGGPRRTPPTRPTWTPTAMSISLWRIWNK